MKILENLLNIVSYAFLAMFCVTVVKIGMKLCGIRIFGNKN